MGAALAGTTVSAGDAAEGTARTEIWLRRGAWAVVAFSCLQILLFGFGRDQGIYAVVGEGLLDGKMPYRDVWDFKPPGIFFVFALAEAAFGRSMASVRVVECAGLVGAAFAFRALGRELFGSATAGLLGGALAALLHAELEFWHTAQPESFGGMLTLAALVLTVGRGTRGATFRERAGAWAAVGVLFGVAFLLKPPLGGGAIVCAGYLAIREFLASGRVAQAAAAVFVVGLSSALPLLACAAFFVLQGAWPALSWTLFEFTPGYTKLGWTGTPHGLFLYGAGEALQGFSYLLPVAIGCALVLPRRHARQWEGVGLIAALFVMHVVGIALQAKFFQYHYGATLPLLSILGGLGLYKSFQLAARGRLPGIAVWLVAAAVLIWSRDALRHNPGTFWERTGQRLAFLVLRHPNREELDANLYYVADYDLDVDRKAGRRIAELTGSGDSIYVWGFEPSIYWFSGRRASSRFVYDVPQRARWQREKSRGELLSDLAKDPPRVIAVQHGDYFAYVTGDDHDSYAALGGFPELARLVETEYRFVESVEDVDLYLRGAPGARRE